MQRHSLVVSVYRLELKWKHEAEMQQPCGETTDLLSIHSERTLAFAIRADHDLDLFVGILIIRPEHIATLSAIELDIFQLGHDARSPRHHTRNAN